MITENEFENYKLELQKIENENNYTYELIPFIEFLIDIISSGESIYPDKIYEWWKLYSDTFRYNGELLKCALKGLGNDLSNSIDIRYETSILARLLNSFRKMFNKK